MSAEQSSLDIGQLLLQASALLDRRRIEPARALLVQGLKSEPGHAGLLYESARADYLADRHADARLTLGQLLRQQPDDADARHLLFWIAMEEGQLAEAEALILGLLRDWPQHPGYYVRYARLMLRALNFGKAEALVAEALQRAPNDGECLRVHAMCELARGRTGSDNKALLQLIIDDPQDGQTLRLLVYALDEAGRGGEAYRLARELLRAQPDDAQLLALVQALAAVNHWSLKPLWPMRRWGWAGAIGIWALGVLGGRVLDLWWPAAGGPFLGLLLCYVIYSWVWPPVLRRWLARRG